MASPRPFAITNHFGFPSGAIASLVLPYTTSIDQHPNLFASLRGVASWEIDGPRSAYLHLEPWMTVARIHELYQAIRHTYGPYVRFGVAAQKTTAYAAARYRSVPHCAVITPAKTEAFLAELPIRLLPGLGDRTTRFLEARGVTTFTAFRQLPTRTLREWFGVSGLILQQFARGLDPRGVGAHAPATAMAG